MKIYVKEPLYGLETNDKFIIGRKNSIFKKYKDMGTLFIGEIYEKHNDKKVYLDSLSPHSIFICGSRGSGKSYTLGVIVEELALKNKNVGIVVVDPIGVFWSMKYKNTDEFEVKELKKYGLEPKGLDNVKVFIPYGFRDKVPRETYDELFSIKVSELTSEDWCLTFGFDRFSPLGLLMDKTIKNTKQRIEDYDIDDLIETLESDEEIIDPKKGFKFETRRALISRLEASKSWGVLSREGNTISDISVKGQVTIIDTSFLEDNVSALVIGILARKILNARKLVARTMTMSKFVDLDLEIIENDIPPTWLFIDEAHTLIPSVGKTPASDALIEYVKQGRRPGCSLVLATQQPAAIDSRVLSQLDIMIAHKLTFEEDVKAVFKRIPSIIPKEFSDPKFLRKLPIGVSVVGDRADPTSRTFLMKTRPRMSQHEGRDILSNEFNLKKEDIIEIIKKNMSKKNFDIEKVCKYFRNKYGIEIYPSDIIGETTEKEINILNYVEKEESNTNIDEQNDFEIVEGYMVEVDTFNGLKKAFVVDDKILGSSSDLSEFRDIPECFLSEFVEVQIPEYNCDFEIIDEIDDSFYRSVFSSCGEVRKILKIKIKQSIGEL